MAKTVVDRQRMLRDQGRGPRIGAQPVDAARPYRMTHAERRADKVHDVPGIGADCRRRIGLGPAVVVLGNRVENRLSPGPCCKRDAMLHDPPRQVRVIRLRNQMQAVISRTNDHKRRLSPQGDDK
jgi:hypothetical protein